MIAIIGILASLLMPALSRAREKANRALCISNTGQQVRSFYFFAESYDGRVPLQYSTGAVRNSAYFYYRDKYFNFANLWREGVVDVENIFVCSSYTGNAVYLGCDNPAVDEFEDLPVASMFNCRPAGHIPMYDPPNDLDEGLVRLDDYNDKAIVSERLYAWYNSTCPFHLGEGVTAGYGDGSALFVDDTSGERFIDRLTASRNNSDYYFDGDGDGDLDGGAWYELDIARSRATP